MKAGFVFRAAALFAAGGIGVMISGCGKHAVEEPADEAEPPPAVALVATPTPPPATPVAVATPVPDPLAPPGVFFLLQKASITTDDGIVGLKPGQVVRQVGPGTYEAEGHQLTLASHQVTNNLRIARQLASADAASQAALRQASAAAAIKAPPAPSGPVNTVVTTVLSTPIPRPALQPTGIGGGSRLGTGAGGADPELANRNNARVDASGRRYWRDSHGAVRYDF